MTPTTPTYMYSESSLTRRSAFLGAIAWLSVCLIIAGIFPSLSHQLSKVWIISGLFGVVSAVGLAEAIKREQSMLRAARSQASTDSLTQTSNRRKFDQILMIELEQARSTLGLILIDLDHFKRYNDTWGHRAGDDLLRLVGTVLKDSARPVDFVCRYGGEEFAILVSDADHQLIISIAENVRENLHRKSTEFSPVGEGTTVSIGVTMKRTGDTEISLIERADRALYAAKASGRNCVYYINANDDRLVRVTTDRRVIVTDKCGDASEPPVGVPAFNNAALPIASSIEAVDNPIPMPIAIPSK